MSQDLRSIFRDLIPEVMLGQKLHIHMMGPIGNGSRVEFLNYSKYIKSKEEHCAFIELYC